MTFSKLFILLFTICLTTNVVYGHGVRETNNEQSFVERPKSFFEYFIPAADARANIRIDEQGGYRYIESDGLPDHATGKFPNPGNPNAISSQDYKFRVPLKPKKRSTPTSIGHAAFGVAINGVPFDPATAEYWNNDRSSNWNIEAMTGGMNLGLDQNNAHVQPNGAYHYHSIPIGLMKKYDYRKQLVLLGYAADGFPIYSPYGYSDPADSSSAVIELRPSYSIKQGTRPDGPRGRYDGTYFRDYEYVHGLGELDQCNGRIGVTPEYPVGIYYYVITDSFPSIPRCWIGSGDSSFQKGPPSDQQRSGPDRGRSEGGMTERRGPGGPGGSSGPGGRGSRPPQEATSACSGRSAGSSCSFRAPHGNIDGTCRSIESDLACVPKGR